MLDFALSLPYFSTMVNFRRTSQKPLKITSYCKLQFAKENKFQRLSPASHFPLTASADFHFIVAAAAEKNQTLFCFMLVIFSSWKLGVHMAPYVQPAGANEIYSLLQYVA